MPQVCKVGCMTEVILPDGPNEIFAVVEPIFTRYFGAGTYRLGGGTALASVWAHRHSTDIDLFIEQSIFRAVMRDSVVAASLRTTFKEKIGPEIVEFSNGFIKGISQLGEFSLMTTPRLLDTESNTRVIDTQVYLEDPAEILAKKIQYRILHNGILVARDLFDIATAYEIAPAALVSALQTITLDERLDIASEIRSLPMQWVGGGESGRELINPQYPKSLATNPEQLISSVERLFRNGPEPLLAQLASGKLTSNPDRMGN